MQTPLSRRRLLRALSLATLSATGVLPLAMQARADAAGLITGSVCMLQPEVTEGPFYVDADLQRQDITEGRPGRETGLRLQIVTADCDPIEGARVDVWHCDAAGLYSGVGAGGAAATDSTFLRGTQFSGGDGVVSFGTVYPGWYQGRTPHIHYKVFLEERRLLTGQLFFPDSVSAAVYADGAYVGRGAPDTLNGEDGIARRAGADAVAAVRDSEGRLDAALVVGVEEA